MTLAEHTSVLWSREAVHAGVSKGHSTLEEAIRASKSAKKAALHQDSARQAGSAAEVAAATPQPAGRELPTAAVSGGSMCYSQI